MAPDSALRASGSLSGPAKAVSREPFLSCYDDAQEELKSSPMDEQPQWNPSGKTVAITAKPPGMHSEKESW